MSPRIEYFFEQLNYCQQMMAFKPERHLKNREAQYVHATNDEIMLVRETEDGWWRESLDFKGDAQAQIEKLRQDDTVAAGWFRTLRFTDKGGWYDPTA